MRIYTLAFALVLSGYLLFTTAAGAEDATATVAKFEDGDRVCFLGDSITHSGYYWEYVNGLYVTRYPQRKIKFFNCGFSGDTAGGGVRRLESDVLVHNPTKVVIMFGMNDVDRGAYFKDEPTHTTEEVASAKERRKNALDWYGRNMHSLVSTLQAKGITVTLLTPTPYDQTLQSKSLNDDGTDDGLEAMVLILRQLGKAFDVPVVDFHSPMNAIIAKMHEEDPTSSLTNPDRIHPNQLGHWVMATLFLKAQGIDPLVASFDLDAAAKVASASLASSAEFVSKPSETSSDLAIECVLRSAALPLPMMDTAYDADKYIGLTKELNQEILCVKNLPEGSYRLTITGSGFTGSLGVMNAQQLASGIGIGSKPSSPAQVQAHNVGAALRRKGDIMRLLRDVKQMEMQLQPDIDSGKLQDTAEAKLTYTKDLFDEYEKKKQGWGCYLARKYLEHISERPALLDEIEKIDQRVSVDAIASELRLRIIRTDAFAADEALRYEFSEGKGQRVDDISGSGNIGLMGSTSDQEGDDPGWTKLSDGKWGLSFDGIYNNRIQVSDAPVLNPDKRLSIQVHVKRTVGQPGVLVNKGWSVYTLGLNMYGSLCFLYRDDTNALYNIDSKIAIPLDKWTDLGVIADATKGEITLTVDGRTAFSHAFKGKGFYRQDHSAVDIGFNNAQKIDSFAGIIDKVIIRTDSTMTNNDNNKK